MTLAKRKDRMSTVEKSRDCRPVGKETKLKGETRLWEMQKSDTMACMCFSRSLLIKQRRENGRKLEGELDGEDDLGM